MATSNPWGIRFKRKDCGSRKLPKRVRRKNDGEFVEYNIELVNKKKKVPPDYNGVSEACSAFLQYYKKSKTHTLKNTNSNTTPPSNKSAETQKPRKSYVRSNSLKVTPNVSPSAFINDCSVKYHTERDKSGNYTAQHKYAREYFKYGSPASVIDYRNRSKAKLNATPSYEVDLTITDVNSRLKHAEKSRRQFGTMFGDAVKLDPYPVIPSEVECFHRILCSMSNWNVPPNENVSILSHFMNCDSPEEGNGKSCLTQNNEKNEDGDSQLVAFNREEESCQSAITMDSFTSSVSTETRKVINYARNNLKLTLSYTELWPDISKKDDKFYASQVISENTTNIADSPSPTSRNSVCTEASLSLPNNLNDAGSCSPELDANELEALLTIVESLETDLPVRESRKNRAGSLHSSTGNSDIGGNLKNNAALESDPVKRNPIKNLNSESKLNICCTPEPTENTVKDADIRNSDDDYVDDEPYLHCGISSNSDNECANDEPQFESTNDGSDLHSHTNKMPINHFALITQHENESKGFHKNNVTNMWARALLTQTKQREFPHTNNLSEPIKTGYEGLSFVVESERAQINSDEDCVNDELYSKDSISSNSDSEWMIDEPNFESANNTSDFHFTRDEDPKNNSGLHTFSEGLNFAIEPQKAQTHFDDEYTDDDPYLKYGISNTSDSEYTNGEPYPESSINRNDFNSLRNEEPFINFLHKPQHDKKSKDTAKEFVTNVQTFPEFLQRKNLPEIFHEGSDELNSVVKCQASQLNSDDEYVDDEPYLNYDMSNYSDSECTNDEPSLECASNRTDFNPSKNKEKINNLPPTLEHQNNSKISHETVVINMETFVTDTDLLEFQNKNSDSKYMKNEFFDSVNDGSDFNFSKNEGPNTELPPIQQLESKSKCAHQNIVTSVRTFVTETNLSEFPHRKIKSEPHRICSEASESQKVHLNGESCLIYDLSSTSNSEYTNIQPCFENSNNRNNFNSPGNEVPTTSFPFISQHENMLKRAFQSNVTNMGAFLIQNNRSEFPQRKNTPEPIRMSFEGLNSQGAQENDIEGSNSEVKSQGANEYSDDEDMDDDPYLNPSIFNNSYRDNKYNKPSFVGASDRSDFNSSKEEDSINSLPPILENQNTFKSSHQNIVIDMETFVAEKKPSEFPEMKNVSEPSHTYSKRLNSAAESQRHCDEEYVRGEPCLSYGSSNKSNSVWSKDASSSDSTNDRNDCNSSKNDEEILVESSSFQSGVQSTFYLKCKHLHDSLSNSRKSPKRSASPFSYFPHAKRNRKEEYSLNSSNAKGHLPVSCSNFPLDPRVPRNNSVAHPTYPRQASLGLHSVPNFNSIAVPEQQCTPASQGYFDKSLIAPLNRNTLSGSQHKILATPKIPNFMHNSIHLQKTLNSQRAALSQLNSSPLKSVSEASRGVACLVLNDLKYKIGNGAMDTHSIRLLMLEWNVDWLMEKNKGKDPPPISQNVLRVSDSYEDFTDYYNTYLPLMLLETWHSIYASWNKHKEAEPFECRITSYIVKHQYVVMECEAAYIEDHHKKIFPESGTILIVKYSILGTDSKVNIFGYVTDVNTESCTMDGDTEPGLFRKLTLAFKVAYYSKNIDLSAPVHIHVLCTVKHNLKQNDALLYLNESPLQANILKPISDGFQSITLEPKSEGGAQQRFEECVHHVGRHLLLRQPRSSFTIIRVKCEEDRLYLIPLLIEKLTKVYETKVLLCVRNPRELCVIAANVCMQQSVNLVIINDRRYTNPQFKKYMLDYHVARKIAQKKGGNVFKNENSTNEVKKQVLKDSDIILTLTRNSHNGFLSQVFQETNIASKTCCIVDEAHLCTETETLLPLHHGILRLILIGEADKAANVLSRTAKQYCFDRSLLHRANALERKLRPQTFSG